MRRRGHSPALGGVVRPGVFDRLYARLGGWYVHALMVALATFFLVVVVPLYSLILIPWFGVNQEQYAEVVLVFAAAIAVAGVGLVTIGLRRHRPVAAWAAGDHSPANAEASWNSALGSLPRSVLLVAAGYSASCVPPALYVSNVIGLSTNATVAYCVALFVLVTGMAVPGYLVLEQAFRPITREAAAVLPDGIELRLRPVSLGMKVLILLPCISLFTSMVAAAVASNSDSLEGRIGLTLLTAIAVNGTVTFGLTLMLRQSLVRRLDDLRGALLRVDGGDLTVRLLRLAEDEIDDVGRSFNQMVSGLRERDALHSAMGSYIDPSIAERVMAEGSLISGESAEVTVMFVDIVGFTNLAEDAIPEEVISDLNDFFGVVIPAIEKRGGHANKLLGDGLMAVFGVPLAMDDHADQAIAAAKAIKLGIQDRYENQLRVGVGLNSGTVIAGSMGGGAKLDYTIIGDTVNVAARVEAYTRHTGDTVLLTDSTRALLSDTTGLTPRGGHGLKGRTAEVQLWATE